MRIDHSKTPGSDSVKELAVPKPAITEPVRIYPNGSQFVAIDSAGLHIASDPSDIVLALQLTRHGIKWEDCVVSNG